AGKELEIISLELDMPVSIESMKAKILRKKSISAEMLSNGRLTPEVLAAFKESSLSKIADVLDEVTDSPAQLDEYELSLLQQFRLKLGEILRASDPAKRDALWNEMWFYYVEILEHKGSYFANMASLDHLASEAYPELKGREIKALDLASGPSTLYQAYQRKKPELNKQGLDLRITDYDISPQMLKYGVRREGEQIVGRFKDVGKLPAASFDVVNLSYAYRYSEKPAKLMRDIYHVLKPDGLFVLILPSTNLIPAHFSESMKKAGFEVRVGEGATLQSKIDSGSYAELVREYGEEFARDVSSMAKGEFTYFVARKDVSIVPASDLDDEDFRVLREMVKMDKEKVQALQSSGGKYKIVPEGTTIVGEVQYRDDELGALAGQEKTLKGPSHKIISKIKRITTLITSLETTSEKTFKKEKIRRDIDRSIEKLLTDLQQAKSKFTDDDVDRVLNELKEFQSKPYVKQWLRQSGNKKWVNSMIGELKQSTIQLAPGGRRREYEKLAAGARLAPPERERLKKEKSQLKRKILEFYKNRFPEQKPVLAKLKRTDMWPTFADLAAHVLQENATIIPKESTPTERADVIIRDWDLKIPDLVQKVVSFEKSDPEYVTKAEWNTLILGIITLYMESRDGSDSAIHFAESMGKLFAVTDILSLDQLASGPKIIHKTSFLMN
ncbi:MAG TPA: class I SAM-dependent methyltransferase, partial [Candidatus Omnitrophota bacterium]|nr:class I SAM-dependent methyltransferase [Candidatus Omnitrophota bacterium]